MKMRSLKWVAKTGYAARGIVYFVVGGLAVAAAAGSGRSTPNTRGALLELFETGYGAVLFAVLGVGLLCYAIWRLFPVT